MHRWAMGLACVAGLIGAAGVAAGAAAAHKTGGGGLETATHYALFHAPAILALALTRSNDAWFLIAATLLAIGTALFSGDLAIRALAGIRPLPLAAPAGGICLIAGWLMTALAAALRFARTRRVPAELDNPPG